MSFTGDILTGNSPARLLCRRGQWLLELVRFVSIDRNVFQPRTQRIEGGDAILQHLKRGEHAALVASTTQLIRGLRVEDEHTFEAADGEWVVKAPEAHANAAFEGESGSAAAATEVTELRAEVLVMRVAHERLRERLLRLESQLANVGESKRNVPVVNPIASFVPPRVEQREVTADPQPMQGRHAASDGSAPEAAPVSIRQPPRIKFPPLPAIVSCLRALIGDKISAKEKKPVAFTPDDGNPYWVSPLIDDDGVEAGIIVADVIATASLGGMLMMLPEHEVESQRKNRAPSEDAVEAMSEVSNNLSGAFNQIPDAPRLRVRPIEPLTPAMLDWVTPATYKMQLEIAGSNGNLFLLSR